MLYIYGLESIGSVTLMLGVQLDCSRVVQQVYIIINIYDERKKWLNINKRTIERVQKVEKFIRNVNAVVR